MIKLKITEKVDELLISSLISEIACTATTWWYGGHGQSASGGGRAGARASGHTSGHSLGDILCKADDVVVLGQAHPLVSTHATVAQHLSF